MKIKNIDKAILLLFGLAIGSPFAKSEQKCLDQVNSFMKLIDFGSFDKPNVDVKKEPRKDRNDILGISNGKLGYSFTKGNTKFHLVPNLGLNVIVLEVHGPIFLGKESPDRFDTYTTLQLGQNCKMKVLISHHLELLIGPADCQKEDAALLKILFMKPEKIEKLREFCSWMSKNNMLNDDSNKAAGAGTGETAEKQTIVAPK